MGVRFVLEKSVLAGFDADQQELLQLTWTLINAIQTGDTEVYALLTSDELSCYEDVCDHRIDGLAFHTSLIQQMAGSDTQPVRFDMLSPRVQVYANTAIVCYTRLITFNNAGKPHWQSYNESRVFVRFAGEEGTRHWKMVHFHRSPV